MLLSNSIQDVIMGINFKNAVYRFQLFLHVIDYNDLF
jgi:hypothetical protein